MFFFLFVLVIAFMQETSVWDSERVGNIGWILDRYSEYLEVGDRIRRGIEGDPCSVYSGGDATYGTVDSITRGEHGTIQFSARMDTGERCDFDNRSIAPEKVWEPDPNEIDKFRGRVYKSNHDDNEGDAYDGGGGGAGEGGNEVMESLDHRLKELERTGSKVERLLAETVRELSGDLLRVYRGEEPRFGMTYADRYDRALTHGRDDEGNTVVSTDDFRGDGRTTKTKNLQTEKFNFAETVKESSVLSD